MTPEELEALDVARSLAAAGVPVFVAPADPASKIGFRLPPRWQQTPADPRVVDAWQPGMALAVVTGHGLDLLDVDPRNGGDPTALNGSVPVAYAAALTPSGGVHSFVRSLGVRSRDNVAPGIDVKAGHEGKGHGFAFIAPTIRTSKVTGQPASYRWALKPDLAGLAAVLSGQAADVSGAGLRALINQARGVTAPAAYAGPTFDQMPPEQQQSVRQWVIGLLEQTRVELEASNDWAPGQTDERGRGWEKLQADAALRMGRVARAVWNDLDMETAAGLFLEAAPVDGTWGVEHAEQKWRQQSGRLDPHPWPAGSAEDEGWRRMGLDPSRMSAVPETAGWTPPSPEEAATRYFGPGGIQAINLAMDTLGYGPLRTGIDDILWSYSEGVWRPDKHVVRDRMTLLLGQRFRTSFVGTVEAVVRGRADRITCDPIPDLINFRNGLLHWRSGELRPHTPDLPSTVQLNVDYDPGAQCPAFEEFIAQIVPADVVPTVWALIGYLMYSGNPLHKAVMLTGTGRNGKGTFLRVLLAMLGRRNVTSVSLHDLVNTRFTTASLFGKLANIAGDIDAGYLENTATFKAITGGDTISAEHKGRDRFDFTPWAVPMFSANKIPASADTTEGYLSRWLVIPFPNNFTGREDRHLDGRLGRPEELQGIAARGIAALGGLLDRGDFELTTSGELAREDFYRRVDQVRTWLADCCHIHPDHPWVPRTELYAAYKQWAFRDGHRAVRASEFYERLEQAGGEPAVIHGTRGFKRIRVLDNGLATITTTSWGPASSQTEAAVVPAPTMGEGVSAGQPASFCPEGAEGAETPHPPIARVRHKGGLEEPAPSAPSGVDDDRDGAVPKAKKPQTEAARAKRLAASEEKRAAAIAAAAGPAVQLPALVTPGAVRGGLELADVDLLLATITGTDAALTVDVEHTGYPIGHADYALRTVQLGNHEFAVDLDAADPDHADLARRHIAAAKALHAHSATADLVPLAVAGLIDIEVAWAKMLDTVIPAKLADPASTGSDPGLKKLAEATLGTNATAPAADEARAALFKAGKWLTETKVTTAVERSGWAQVDPGCETMVRYAASDVLDCAAVARTVPWPAADQLHRERTAQRMTARIAYHGLPINRTQVETLLPIQRAALQDAAGRLGGFGVENAGSDQQVGAVAASLGAVLPRTPTGKLSVAKGAIEQYAKQDGPLGDFVRARLDYQKAETALGLFLEPYQLLLDRGDGRARPTVYTLGADTGRMSCVRPNLQQVPREGGFRACLTADPGHVLISADFSGVELRVAAALSQDPNLIAMLEQGVDLHWEAARQVFGPNATKADRYDVKRGVFGWLYGGGVPTLAKSMRCTEQTARALSDTLSHLLPGVTEWARMTKQGVDAGRTQFQTYAGRIVHMPVKAPHAGPNYCIQGTARELLIDALMAWEQTRWGKAVILPVHDEVLGMVPEEEAEEATAALVSCMETELFGIPIVVEASETAFAWQDAA